eukprot:UN23678
MYYHMFRTKLENEGIFEVHEYWSINKNIEKQYSLDDLQVYRSERMREQFPERDDYKVEKSKCVMNDFLKKNNINLGEVLKIFTDKSKFWDYLKNDFDDYPVVIKFCHLTQGSQAGYAFKGGNIGNSFSENKDSINEDRFHTFVEVGMDLVGVDPDRPWTEYVDKLLAAVDPRNIYSTGVENISE